MLISQPVYILKFTIITATIGRDTLQRACKSLQQQSYTNYQHIVVFDGHKKDFQEEDYKHKNRIFLYSGMRHNDYGNMAKHLAYPHIKGDYVLYLDDDNYYINDTLSILNEWLNDYKRKYKEYPDWGVFPMIYIGDWFFKQNPGLYRTDGGQIFHKPIINKEEIRWPKTTEPCEDGKLIDKLNRIIRPAMIKIKTPLINFPKANSVR